MTKTISLRNFDFISLTDKGVEREKNEDYLAYFDTFNGHVFVVCDGIGGHSGGEIASEVAVEAIGDFFNSNYEKNPFDAIESAINFANKRVFFRAKKDIDLLGMGTTIVLVLIRDNMVYYGHAGDSRLYTFLNDKLQLLTRDHSYVNQLVDKNIISEKDAKLHPRSNEITKALGIEKTIVPDVTSSAFIPKENDVLLLCSDGLNNMLSDKNMQQIISTNETLEKKASELIYQANNSGGFDNISVQLIRFHNIETNYEPKALDTWEEKLLIKHLFKKKKYFIAASIIILLTVLFFASGDNVQTQTNGYNLIILKGQKTTEDGKLMIFPYKIDGVDNIETIAEKFNVNLQFLKSLNPNIHELIEGQHLKIPIQDTYIVQSDDEIEIICNQYSINSIDLMRVNDFCSIKLEVGSELIIPLAEKSNIETKD